MKLLIRNLARTTSEAELRAMFEDQAAQLVTRGLAVERAEMEALGGLRSATRGL